MLSIKAALHDAKLLVTVTPPDAGPPPHKHICAVVDVSYSMHGAANDKGDEMVKWFSKLDIVTHGIKTVVAGLSEYDTFTLVRFSSNASVVLPATRMDAAGRAAATAAAESLRPGGGTMLWEALKLGLDQLAEAREDVGTLAVLLLLTDGEPSESPPSGEVQSYRDYVRATAGSPPTLLAFGFGYDVKSKLLRDLADAAGGASAFGFIPDGTMNATVHNCAVANLEATFASDVTIKVKSGIRVVSTSTHGSVQYGQPRTFVLDAPQDSAPIVSVACRFPSVSMMGAFEAALGPVDEAELEQAQLRLQGVRAIHDALRVARADLGKAREIVKAAAMSMLDANPPILADLLGEVSAALADAKAFNRWGEHYLRFVADASEHQRRNNFKDPGGLAWGGGPFKQKLAKLNDAFLGLGVPTPSLMPRVGPVTGVPVTYQATVTGFADAYNNAQGGCFALDCLLSMGDGSTKRVGDVRKGDVVDTGRGAGTVRVVVQYESPTRVIRLKGGPTITPWHPVLVEGRWQFPANLPKEDEHVALAVRTFVLEGGGTVVVDGVVAVALGHGLTQPVAAHHYYGTDAVIRDLEVFPGWSEGVVTISNENKIMKQMPPDGDPCIVGLAVRL